MHNKTYLLPVLFFLVLSIPVQADEFDRKELQLKDYHITLSQDEPYRSALFHKCINTTDGIAMNSEYAACAKDEFDRKEIQLDDYYKTLKRISTKEQQMLLTKGQQAWMTYREDWCRVEEQSAEAPGGRSNYYICLLEKTEKQMEVINRFSFEKLH